MSLHEGFIQLLEAIPFTKVQEGVLFHLLVHVVIAKGEMVVDGLRMLNPLRFGCNDRLGRRGGKEKVTRLFGSGRGGCRRCGHSATEPGHYGRTGRRGAHDGGCGHFNGCHACAHTGLLWCWFYLYKRIAIDMIIHV